MNAKLCLTFFVLILIPLNIIVFQGVGDHHLDSDSDNFYASEGELLEVPGKKL